MPATCRQAACGKKRSRLAVARRRSFFSDADGKAASSATREPREGELRSSGQGGNKWVGRCPRFIVRQSPSGNAGEPRARSRAGAFLRGIKGELTFILTSGMTLTFLGGEDIRKICRLKRIPLLRRKHYVF
jgi:hypothetical protein